MKLTGIKIPIIIGFIAGIILAIGNIATLGIFGNLILPTIVSPSLRTNLLLKFMPECSELGCAVAISFIDGILIIAASVIIAILIYLNHKYFIKKEKTNLLLIVIIILDILFIGLVTYSSLQYSYQICLQNDDCIVKKAIQANSAQICKDVIADRYGKTFIFDPVNYEWHKDEDMSSMYSSSGNKEGCYSKLALEMKNETLCEKIQDKTEKNNCYIQATRVIPNIELCYEIDVDKSIDNQFNNWPENYSQFQQDYCFKNIAVQTNDISKCDLIQNVPAKLMCFSMVKNDKSYCDRIDQEERGFTTDIRIECKNYFKNK